MKNSKFIRIVQNSINTLIIKLLKQIMKLLKLYKARQEKAICKNSALEFQVTATKNACKIFTQWNSILIIYHDLCQTQKNQECNQNYLTMQNALSDYLQSIASQSIYLIDEARNDAGVFKDSTLNKKWGSANLRWLDWLILNWVLWADFLYNLVVLIK